MRCPDCKRDGVVSGCICGWVNPERPRVNVRDHQEESPRVSSGQARAALADIGRTVGRHLSAGLGRDQIIANWEHVRDHGVSVAVRNMAKEALKRLGATAERVPGEDDGGAHAG